MSQNVGGKIVVIKGASSGLGESTLATSQNRARRSSWERGARIVSMRL